MSRWKDIEEQIRQLRQVPEEYEEELSSPISKVVAGLIAFARELSESTML